MMNGYNIGGMGSGYVIGWILGLVILVLLVFLIWLIVKIRNRNKKSNESRN